MTDTHVPAAARGLPKKLTYIQSMMIAWRSVLEIADAHSLPDEAMTALMVARQRLADIIIETPALTAVDVAEKFRMAADLIDNRDENFYDDEPHLIAIAYRELVRFRHADWRRTFGQDCPAYSTGRAA